MEERVNFRILWAIAIFLGVAHNILFFKHGLGINVPVFVLLALAGGILLARRFNVPVTKEQIFIFLIPAFIFSAMAFFRASEPLILFNLVAVVFLFSVFAVSFLQKSIRSFILMDYLKIVFLPIHFVRSFFETGSKIFDLSKIFKKNPVTAEVVRGSIIALILIFVFSLLFASADDVFRKLVLDLRFIEIDPELFGRLVLIAIISGIFIGAFGHMLTKRLQKDEVHVPDKRVFGKIETMIILGGIDLLFLLFIALQFAYLYGGEARVTALGLTYSEYARKGFFELVVVAILSFIVIFEAEKRTVQSNDSHNALFKASGVFLIAEVLLILISAFARLMLYENAYGFTDIRFYSYALMIWIGSVFLLFARHILFNGRQENFLFRVLILSVLFLFGINVLNPEAFVARSNIRRYTETGKLDTAYLARLSDDALPETIGLLNEPNTEIRDSFAKEFYRIRSREDLDKKDWASVSLPKMRAQKLLAPWRAQLEESRGLTINPEQ